MEPITASVSLIMIDIMVGLIGILAGIVVVEKVRDCIPLANNPFPEDSIPKKKIRSKKRE
jgi:hypothetical protein